MDFYIDIKSKMIINKSDIDICIDRFVISKNESLNFIEGMYQFSSGAMLDFTLD